MHWQRMALFAATASALVWMNAAAVEAASLRMTPVGLDLSAPEKAGAISLTNTASEPVDLQVRIFKWSQVDGKDDLTDTRDVIVSPPVTTIKGGDTYTLRVVRVANRPVVGEEAYRLVIDELPKPIDPRATGQGVRMVLRSSMPVFFTAKDIRPDLQFKAWTEGGKSYLQVVNAGQRHAKLAGMKLVTPQGELSFGGGLNGYVLSGQTMKFEAPTDKVKPAPVVDKDGKPDPKAAAGPETRLDSGMVQLVSGIGSSIDVKQMVAVEAK
ncbi:molecular chaperone [Sphingomonas sp.]|jgi:fimbrial chaperone protein|uniref:fimbrial biogenesis chaperone n=1 Tax=Sphingomonas sp. TaxID=28214 RepID=UPI0035C828D3